mgnify:FL=1
MQRVSVGFLEAGMVAARNVHSAEGRLLVTKDTVLSEAMVANIQKTSLGSIYVRNPLFQDIEAEEVVTEDNRRKAVMALKSAVTAYQKTKVLDIQPLKKVLRELVVEIIRNRDSMIHQLDMRTYQDYIYAHSVNTCVLSVLIAVNLDYPEGKLTDLALGTMLHDVGMMMLPDALLMKMGNLTPEESKQVQQHPEDGFNILRTVREIPITVAHIAYQHHERVDGKGYPRNLTADKILEFAKVAAVADTFDALVSDRPYRKGMVPHEAYEVMMALADSYVDRDILHLFLTHVAIYPVGAVVQLDNGQHGVVTKVLPRLQTRPQVRLLTDQQGNLLSEQTEIDLTQHLTLMISRVLKEKEVFELGKKVGM